MRTFGAPPQILGMYLTWCLRLPDVSKRQLSRQDRNQQPLLHCLPGPLRACGILVRFGRLAGPDIQKLLQAQQRFVASKGLQCQK